jgi:hypothetical protein
VVLLSVPEGKPRRLRVLDLVPFEEAGSSYVGLLRVERASKRALESSGDPIRLGELHEGLGLQQNRE